MAGSWLHGVMGGAGAQQSSTAHGLLAPVEGDRVAGGGGPHGACGRHNDVVVTTPLVVCSYGQLAPRHRAMCLQAEVALHRVLLKEVVGSEVCPVGQRSEQGVCIQPWVVSARHLGKDNMTGSGYNSRCPHLTKKGRTYQRSLISKMTPFHEFLG